MIVVATRSFTNFKAEGRVRAGDRFSVGEDVPGLRRISPSRAAALKVQGLMRDAPGGAAPPPKPAKAPPTAPRPRPSLARAAVPPAAQLAHVDIKAFLLEPLMRRRFYLRRYSPASTGCAKGKWGCGTAMVLLPGRDEDFAWVVEPDGYQTFPPTPEIDHADPRWPSTCERCGGAMPADAVWQVMQEQLYRRVDTGELIAHRYMPPGSLYFQDPDKRYGEFAGVFPGGGPDGRVLSAVCPGGARWCIDSRANNCTMPNDDKHRCWVRHGDPAAGTIHVDKNGLTCKAGAGSIKTGNWHGYLDHGFFRERRRVPGS
jgi:hypothetical protein